MQTISLTHLKRGIVMNEKEAWNKFYHSGKINDYISYVNLKNDEAELSARVDDNADKDKSAYNKAEEYR